jgi:predicted ester cyclase
MKATAALMHGALADCRCELDDVIADGDRIAVRYTTRARHVGELFGAAPSGRSATFTGIEVFRVLDDKIVEYWGEATMSDLFSTPPEPATVR